MLKAVDATEMVPTVPLQFARSCPVGKSRTAGCCLQGFDNVHRLLLENRRHEHEQLQGHVKLAGCWCCRTHVAQVYPRQFVDML